MAAATAPNSAPVGLEPRPWRVVFPFGLWERLLRELLDQPERWVVGPWRWQTTSTFHEALIDGLRISDTPLPGTERPAGDRWFCLRLIPGMTPARLAEFLRSCEPRPSQTLLAIAIDPQGGPAWGAAVVYRDDRTPVSELRVTGPAPLTLSREPGEPRDFCELRWSRTQMAVREPALQFLRQATVNQVGAGRLGTLMAWQWASLGVKRLRLFDPDTLYLHNISEMPGLAASQLNESKLNALSRALQRFRPDLELTLVYKDVRHREAPTLLQERADLIVTCVDDDLPRLVASQIARRMLMSHLDVGSHIIRDQSGRRMLADARLMHAGSGCVRCVGGMPNLSDIQRRLAAPPHAIPQRRPVPWWQQRAGSLLSLNSMIAGAAAQMWLDSIAGDIRSSFWQRLEWTPDRGIVAEAGNVRRAENCPLCLGREVG